MEHDFRTVAASFKPSSFYKFRGYRSDVIDDSGLLGRGAVSLGKWLCIILKNTVPLSSGVKRSREEIA
jgi:hypothetical protein